MLNVLQVMEAHVSGPLTRTRPGCQLFEYSVMAANAELSVGIELGTCHLRPDVATGAQGEETLVVLMGEGILSGRLGSDAARNRDGVKAQ